MSEKTIIDRTIANADDLRQALDELAGIADLRDVIVQVSSEGIQEADSFYVIEQTLTDNSVVHYLLLA